MYDGKTYTGVTEEVVNGEYHVNVLHQCKSIYMMNDICTYMYILKYNELNNSYIYS